MTLTPDRCGSLFPVRFLFSPRNKFNDDQLLTVKARLDVITKNLLDDFSKWRIAQRRGLSRCNAIEAIKKKCFEGGDTLFPEELKTPCDKLAIILTVFEDIIESTKESLKQLNALAKITTEHYEVPLYRTWRINDFAGFTTHILERYKEEYRVKQFIAEGIAHCPDKGELVRIASLWEYPIHVDDGVKVMFSFMAKEVRE